MNKALNLEIQISIIDESVRTLLPPVIDRSFKTKKVILIHTSNYKSDAIDLSNAYKNFNIETVFEPLSTSHNLLKIEDQIEEILKRYQSFKPVVNVSNGSKLHSIALYNVAKNNNLSIFCVNADDTLSWLWPDPKEGIDIEDRVKIPTFLEANGFNYLSDSTTIESHSLNKLLTWMLENITSLKTAITQLNFYAYSAKKDFTSLPFKGDVRPLKLLINEFEAAGLAKIKNNRIHFLNEDVRFFANGGWLEKLIHHKIYTLKKDIPELKDFRSSVEVSSKLHNVKNEVDNVALVNNRLFLIECKTKKFTNRGHPEGGAMDALYKMDTLMSELGGPIAKGMIVSVFPFSAAEIKRAKQYDIELISFEKIINVEKYLKAWFLS
jgi:hypothetical protein